MVLMVLHLHPYLGHLDHQLAQEDLPLPFVQSCLRIQLDLFSRVSPSVHAHQLSPLDLLYQEHPHFLLVQLALSLQVFPVAQEDLVLLDFHANP